MTVIILFCDKYPFNAIVGELRNKSGNTNLSRKPVPSLLGRVREGS
jgi:hypothetical protein